MPIARSIFAAGRGNAWTPPAEVGEVDDAPTTNQKYVRQGASGSGSGDDWTNAYTDLPGTLVRDTTYWLADGSYSGYTFDDAVSGSLVIRVRKASAGLHGTDTGWATGYGDGVATMGALSLRTDYILVHGGAAENVQGITLTGDANIVAAASNISLRGLDFSDGRSCYWSPTAGGSHSPTASENCYVGYCRFYGASNPAGEYTLVDIFGSGHVFEFLDITGDDVNAFRVWGTGHVIRNCNIHDISRTTGFSEAAVHPDGWQTFGDNGWESSGHIIESCVMSGGTAQPMNLSHDWVAGIDDWTFRNCVIYGIDQISGGIYSNFNLGITNLKFYNCTFYDCVSTFNFPVNGEPWLATGFTMKNCLIVGMAGNAADYGGGNSVLSGSPPSMTRGTNFWSRLNGTALGAFSSSGGDINGGTVAFVDAAGGDFRLASGSSAIGAGTDLSSTGFSTDIAGVTRVTWDIGAYAYV
jgi:hypothetical protein